MLGLPSNEKYMAGRTIDDCFERGIALQFAEQLKKNLEFYSGIRVIVSRYTEKNIESMHNANFANRLNVDLYLSLHFFEEKQEKPTLNIYRFLYHPVIDYWPLQSPQLSFIPYDQAHRQMINITQSYTEIFFNTLQSYQALFEIKGIFGLPFKPLIGIKSPAFALEASLKEKDSWKLYVEPMTTGIVEVYKRAINA